MNMLNTNLREKEMKKEKRKKKKKKTCCGEKRTMDDWGPSPP